MEKFCIKCEKLKDIKVFHKDKNKRLGVGSYCKDCDNKRWKEYIIKLNSPKMRLGNKLTSQ